MLVVPYVFVGTFTHLRGFGEDTVMECAVKDVLAFLLRFVGNIESLSSAEGRYMAITVSPVVFGDVLKRSIVHIN